MAQVNFMWILCPCEFYEIFKNIFFKEHLHATASVLCLTCLLYIKEASLGYSFFLISVYC